MTGLRVAVTPANSPEDRRLLRSYLPNAKLVELESIKDFFPRPDVADALLTTDKIGKAWALLYPEFGVVVPKPHLFVYDVAYPIPIAKGDYIFLEYLEPVADTATNQRRGFHDNSTIGYWARPPPGRRHDGQSYGMYCIGLTEPWETKHLDNVRHPVFSDLVSVKGIP